MVVRPRAPAPRIPDMMGAPRGPPPAPRAAAEPPGVPDAPSARTGKPAPAAEAAVTAPYFRKRRRLMDRLIEPAPWRSIESPPPNTSQRSHEFRDLRQWRQHSEAWLSPRPELCQPRVGKG